MREKTWGKSQFRRKMIEHDGKLIDTAAGPIFFFWSGDYKHEPMI